MAPRRAEPRPCPVLTSRSHIRIACFAGIAVFAMSSQVMPPGLESIAEDFTLTAFRRGSLFAFQYAGYFATSLVGGWASDHFGRKRFLCLGFYLTALGLVSASFAPGYGALAASMMLIGGGGGFVEALTSVLISDLYAEQSGRQLNLSQIFYNVGAIGMSFAVGWALGMGLGWRPGYLFGAALAVGCGAWINFLTIPVARRHDASGEAHLGSSGWLVAVLAGAMLMYVGAEMTVNSWSANYLSETFGMARSSAAYSLSLFWFTMLVGRMVYARIVESLGYLPPIVFSCLLGAVGGAVMVFSPSGTVAFAGVGLTGLALAGVWPTVLAYAGTRFPTRSGRVFGIIVSCGSLGLVVFPAAAGAVADLTPWGLRAGMALVPALLLAIAGVAGWLWARDRRRGSVTATGTV